VSWIQKLYETYQNCQSMVGAGSDESKVPLLPICHTTQKAQVEITLDETGKFRRANVIPKEESRTIIPCTEKSAGRTSGEAAFPLCDKLQYIAADYKDYGGEKTPCNNLYIDLLSGWVEAGAPKKVLLVYEYVKLGRVIADLVAHRILFIDHKNELLFKRPGEKDRKDRLGIFDLLPGRINPKNGKRESWQAEAFVRWRVEIPNDHISAVWSDPAIIQSWIDYYSSSKETKALCYVVGEESFSADQHPAKLRNDGDKAKLISSGKSRDKTGEAKVDDGCGFTFLGRFLNADQAATVGFETTQKAHFALRWLISRQGYRKGDLAIIAWATSGVLIPQPTDSPLSILGISELPTDEKPVASTAQEMALRLRKKIAGYGNEIGDTTDVVVMGLDSATPGRMAIIYYRDLTSSDFLKRIDAWQDTCAWMHHYGEVQDKITGKTKKNIPFIGAPAPVDIAEAAYGSRLDDKLRKATISRLLPCVVDGQPIPRDLVESAVRRASNRVGIKNLDDKKYHSDEEYTWKKSLSIACALFRKIKQGKEHYEMSLDETRSTRDYLYGRLLAIADILEEKALYKGEQKRATNAARYMQQFSQRPFRTWKQIHDSLTPYILRLGGAYYYKNLIAEVGCLFDPDDFMLDKPLTGEYLLGYYCQRQKLLEKKVKPVSSEDEGTDENSKEQNHILSPNGE
jgi:CRISPR-associated protein Csd1